MRAYRDTPHTATGETANLLMLDRELRLPDQLQHQPLRMKSVLNMSS